MSIELFIYLAEVIPNLSNAFTAIGLVMLVASVFIGCCWEEASNYQQEAAKIWKKTFFSSLFVALFTGLFAVLCPSKQTMYLMAGASVAKDAINSSTGQKVKQLIDKELDKLIAPKESK